MNARSFAVACFALAFFGGVLAIAGKTAAKTPVVLDTDIGDDIDDTWALAMLLRSPDLDLKLVTTTCGRAEYRAKIVARLLTVARRTDVPIGLGAGGREGTNRQQAWVKDCKLNDYAGKVYEDGVAAMIEMVEKSPTPVTIISIGPLDTLGAALQRRPGIAPKSDFVGMQGCVRIVYGADKKADKTNLTAEYNVKTNIPASQRVFSAPWRHVAITPLDTCGFVRLTGERLKKLKQSQDPLVRAVLENYRIWSDKANLDQLDASSTLYDTAAIYLAYPGQRPLMKLETLPIRVDDHGYTRINPAGRKMSVATEWADLDGYHDLLVNTLLGK